MTTHRNRINIENLLHSTPAHPPYGVRAMITFARVLRAWRFPANERKCLLAVNTGVHQ